MIRNDIRWVSNLGILRAPRMTKAVRKGENATQDQIDEYLARGGVVTVGRACPMPTDSRRVGIS